MWDYRVLAIGLVVIAGSASAISGRASAQECFPFPWLCQQRPAEPRYQPGAPDPRDTAPSYERGYDRRSGAAYGPVAGERFPVPAVPMSEVDPNYLRAAVSLPLK